MKYCWRCQNALLGSTDPHSKTGLCASCEEDVQLVSRGVLVMGLFILVIAGVVLVATYLPSEFVCLWITGWLIAVILFFLYKEGWFGWIGFLKDQYRGDRDNDR